MNKICKCNIIRGSTPQNEHDARVNMKMTHITTKNGFYRICLMCNKPLYLRDALGPYDKSRKFLELY